MARQRRSDLEFQPRIRRGRIETLDIFEISEGELELLVQGSSNSTFLNFAIGLLSIALSFLIALLTTTIESERTFSVFVLLAAVGGVTGSVLLVLWYRGSQSVAELVERIKNRLPAPEGEPETPSA